MNISLQLEGYTKYSKVLHVELLPYYLNICITVNTVNIGARSTNHRGSTEIKCILCVNFIYILLFKLFL